VLVICGTSNSGAVKGERGGTPLPQILGERRSPNDIRTKGNDDTVAFPQAGLQRNAKCMVSRFSEKSLQLLPPGKGGEGKVGGKRRGREGGK